mgnify:CR=1 FL=1
MLISAFGILLLPILFTRVVNDQTILHEILLLVEVIVMTLVIYKFPRTSLYILLLFMTHINLYFAVFHKKIGSRYTFERGFYHGEAMATFNIIPLLFLNRFLMKIAILLIIYLSRFLQTDMDSFPVFSTLIVYLTPFLMYLVERRKAVEAFVAEDREKRFQQSLFNVIETHLPTEVGIFVKRSRRLVFGNDSFKKVFGKDGSLLKNLKVFLDPSKQSQTTDVYEIIDSPADAKKIKNYHATFSTKGGDSPQTTSKYNIKVVNTIFNGHESTLFFFKKEEKSQTPSHETKGVHESTIAMVTHELRTPLIGMMGMLNVLEKKISGREAKKYLNICTSSGRLLLGLINSIIDFDLLNNNKLQLNREYVEVESFLEEIKYPMSVIAEQKNLQFVLKVDPDLPTYIYTDKNRLQQVLINLIGNAIKFTFEGSVTLKVWTDQKNSDLVEFSIIDTGIGISKENQSKLFKMYGKLDDSAKVNKFGAGIGLNISQKLVEVLTEGQEGCGIKVESQEGKGSTFSFKIMAKEILQVPEKMMHEIDHFEIISPTGLMGTSPDMDEVQMASERPLLSRYVITKTGSDYKFSKESIADYSQSEVKKLTTEELPRLQSLMDLRLRKNESAGSKSSFGGTPKGSFLADMKMANESILLVDDNPINLLAATSFAKELGLKVKTALNGKLAIECAKEQAKESSFFKLILLDCIMPVMDGYETAKQLKELMAKGEIPMAPIIALTAGNTPEEKKKALDAGMNDFVTKPLDQRSLYNIFERFNMK